MRFAARSRSASNAVIGRAHALLRDRGLLLRRVALAVQQARDRGHHRRAVLQALLVRLRDQLILLRELLVGEIACVLLRCAGHGASCAMAVVGVTRASSLKCAMSLTSG
jgi:hypothetical protein